MANDAATVDARTPASQPRVAPLREEDLPEAARIIRVPFGTFLGAPDPEIFWTDRDYAFGRHPASHVASFGATMDEKLVGSNFAVNWGGVGFFGQLSVLPDLQERGIARALLAGTMEQFDACGNRHSGCLRSRKAPSILPSIRSTAFTRAFLPRSCRRRRDAGKHSPNGRALAP